MKLITRIAAAALAMGLSVSATAQNDRAWTLDQCVEYAVAHNIDVRSRLLNVREADQSVTEAKDRFLPRLSGYGSQNFNFGRGLTADNTYANRNTSSFSVGANLSLPLFQGLSAIRNLDYARTNMQAVLEQCEAAKDDVTLNVISQYLQALYASELCAVARERLAISTGELSRRLQLLEAGKIPELDIFEARSQVSQDELSVVNCANDSVIALLDLAQMLNLPSAEGFAIRPLEESQMPLLSPDDVYENALQRNHLVRSRDWSLRAAEKNISVARAGYIPTLSFSAGLGTNYYKTSGFNNENFGAQMRHNFAKSIGFSLSVPIFDAFSTRNSVRRAKIAAESARLQVESTQLQLYKAINQAYTQAVGAHKKQQAAAVAVESSRAAFDAMRVKYDNGRANATEFEKSRSEYTNALAEAVQAKYEAILRARILQFYNK